jgi:hypothetical protein
MTPFGVKGEEAMIRGEGNSLTVRFIFFGKDVNKNRVIFQTASLDSLLIDASTICHGSTA